jgi:putative transposase
MLFVQKYDPKIHHRRSIRLRSYNYSRAGRYFITICCQGHVCRFGAVESGKMILNDAGKMIEKWHLELPHKFNNIELGAYIIMPNHFHAIIINTVRADLRVRPIGPNDTGENIIIDRGDHVGSPLSDSPQPDGSPLPRIVQWFKTMTTNEYIRGVKNLGWKRFDGKLWQRDYYEHIIRDEKSFIAITKYINNNPSKWNEDQLYRNNDPDR